MMQQKNKMEINDKQQQQKAKTSKFTEEAIVLNVLNWNAKSKAERDHSYKGLY